MAQKWKDLPRQNGDYFVIKGANKDAFYIVLMKDQELMNYALNLNVSNVNEPCFFVENLFAIYGKYFPIKSRDDFNKKFVLENFCPPI